MTLSYDSISVWSNVNLKRFHLYRNQHDTSPLELGINDTIIWDGRDTYVKIVEVIGTEEETGPRGFVYLPWREGRWASPMYSLRGDPRYIICYPEGSSHYGLHVGLHTIEKDEVPIATHLERPYYMDTVVELRYHVDRATQGRYIVDGSMYNVTMDNFEYEAHLFQHEDVHVVDLRFISGCKKSFIEHTKYYECM